MQASENDQDDCHIASIVLWVGESAAEVQDRLSKLSWVECPLPAEKGKCVAVLTASTDEELISRIDYIRDLPDVINAQLVYHAFDEAEIKN